MRRFETIIRTLASNNVDFVIVGGVAITLHGSAYNTDDFDFCYSRANDNLKRIALALKPLNPRLRGFPDDLPFFWDERTLQHGTNFTLMTDLGDIDLLGEVAGIGDYQAVLRESEEINFFELKIRILSVDGLIQAKRTANRPKDLLVLPELEAMREALLEED